MKNICFFSIIFSLFFFSCGGGGETVKKIYDYERSDSLPTQYSTHLGNIRVSIEEVNLLNSMFFKSGYQYNSGILNPPGKVSGYSNTKSEAINLGIYGSDLNYSLAFNQNQEVLNCLNSIVELAKKLGIEKAFDETLIKQLTESGDTISDKSTILTKAYRHAQDQLHNEERAAIASLIVFGGWMEGLYIATSNLKSKLGNAEINQKVFENLDTFYDVTEMLKTFKDKNKNCEEILSEISGLFVIVENLINTRGNFSAENIESLNKAIAELRNKLI